MTSMVIKSSVTKLYVDQLGYFLIEKDWVEFRPFAGECDETEFGCSLEEFEGMLEELLKEVRHIEGWRKSHAYGMVKWSNGKREEEDGESGERGPVAL